MQLLQVLTVAFGAPGLTGVIAKAEARLQGRRGPRVLQPYYDLAKLARSSYTPFRVRQPGQAGAGERAAHPRRGGRGCARGRRT
jgi:hypothetical protein